MDNFLPVTWMFLQRASCEKNETIRVCNTSMKFTILGYTKFDRDERFGHVFLDMVLTHLSNRCTKKLTS